MTGHLTFYCRNILREEINIYIVLCPRSSPNESIGLHHFLHLQLHLPASWSWKCISISFHLIVIVIIIVLLPIHNVAPCKTSHQLIGIYAFPCQPFSLHLGQGQARRLEAQEARRPGGPGGQEVGGEQSQFFTGGGENWTNYIWPAL